MKKTKHIMKTVNVIFVLLLGMIQIPINAQEDRTNQMNIDKKNTLFDNLINYKTLFLPVNSPDRTQLICYTKVTNDLLQFIRKDTVYTAQFELAIYIQNPKGKTIASKIKRQEVSTIQFIETNSKDLFTRDQFNFYLIPGEYNLFLELLDMETKIPFQHQEKIVLPDFHLKPLVATDILFFHSLDIESLFPDFPAVYSPQDSAFWARCYIHSSIDSLRNISIKQTTFQKDGYIVHVDSFDVHMDSSIVPITVKIDDQLDFGQYTLFLQISNTISKISIEEPFYVLWKNHSTLLPGLDDLIETMRYIMDTSQWKNLVNQSKEEQERTIETFWKERDPTPSTTENELEEEYFRRVAFSNQSFSVWEIEKEGWETDRGKIYIIHGKPTHIENPSSAENEFGNYEIWVYNHLNKRFIFFDRHEMGDYRLISEE